MKAEKGEIDRKADAMVPMTTCRSCYNTGQAYTRHAEYVGPSVETQEGVIHTRRYICGCCACVILCGVNENKEKW